MRFGVLSVDIFLTTSGVSGLEDDVIHLVSSRFLGRDIGVKVKM